MADEVRVSSQVMSERVNGREVFIIIKTEYPAGSSTPGRTYVVGPQGQITGSVPQARHMTAQGGPDDGEPWVSCGKNQHRSAEGPARSVSGALRRMRLLLSLRALRSALASTPSTRKSRVDGDPGLRQRGMESLFVLPRAPRALGYVMSCLRCLCHSWCL